MTHTQRIALRAAQAAAYLGCSTASIWRWSRSLPGFPKPRRSVGRRHTYWFKDELDGWQHGQGASHKTLLDFSWFRTDEAFNDLGITDDQQQPFITAFLLAGGGSLKRLSLESSVSVKRLKSLSENSDSVADEEMIELFRVACSMVLYREKQLARQLSSDPRIANDLEFRKSIDDLNRAHQICFGRTLAEYALASGQEGDAHETA